MFKRWKDPKEYTELNSENTITDFPLLTNSHVCDCAVMAFVFVLAAVGSQSYSAFVRDGFSMVRTIALVAVVPVAALFLFGCLQYFMASVLHIFSSVRPLSENSHFFSGIPTKRETAVRY